MAVRSMSFASTATRWAERSMAIGPAVSVDPLVTAGAPRRWSSAVTRSASSAGEKGLVR